LAVADLERFFESANEFSRERLDFARTVDVLEQHGELVAAEPRDEIAFGNAGLEPLRNRS
jgi:hypothetical protein